MKDERGGGGEVTTKLLPPEKQFRAKFMLAFIKKNSFIEDQIKD